MTAEHPRREFIENTQRLKHTFLWLALRCTLAAAAIGSVCSYTMTHDAVAFGWWACGVLGVVVVALLVGALALMSREHDAREYPNLWADKNRDLYR